MTDTSNIIRIMNNLPDSEVLYMRLEDGCPIIQFVFKETSMYRIQFFYRRFVLIISPMERYSFLYNERDIEALHEIINNLRYYET